MDPVKRKAIASEFQEFMDVRRFARRPLQALIALFRCNEH
jgi:hypothetical protein